MSRLRNLTQQGRRYLFVLFFILAVVPLGLLAYLSISLSSEAVTREAETGARDSAAISSVFLRQRFQDVADRVESYAQRRLTAALRDGDPANYDLKDAQFQLASLTNSKTGIEVAYLTDTSGRVAAIAPANPFFVGTQLSYEDWYQGLTSTGRTYISIVTVADTPEYPRVVTVATPIWAPPQGGSPLKLLGIMVSAYNLKETQQFTTEFAHLSSISLTIVDKRGTVVASSTGPSDGLLTMRDDPRVKKGLSAQSGLTEIRGSAGPVFSAYTPIASMGWVVIADVPAAPVQAAVARLRTSVLLIAGTLTLVLLASLVLLLRALQQIEAQRLRATLLQRRIVALKQLNEAARSVHGSRGTTLQSIADTAQGLVDGDVSALLVFAPGSTREVESFVYQGSGSLSPESFVRLTEAPGFPHQPVRIADARSAAPAIPALGTSAPIGPLLAIPLVAGAQVFGLLAVARSVGSQAFDEEDEGLVQQLAQHAMTAVQNARHEAERERARAQLTRQATTDPLTDLANRGLLVHRLGEALTRSEQGARTIAILFLDLDNFKTINDTYGHVVGDRLLVQVAERLLACVRSSDTVCRLGGDEFAIMLEAASGVTEAETVAARILKALRQPVMVEGKELLVQASIGIAQRTPGALEQSVELLRNADVAMYKAKADGKARYVVFEPKMHSTMLERLALESDLRLAVQRQEFVVHYQPIFSLETCRPIALEALVRWQHPERGLLSPGDFIPLAEQTGLIVPIGWWVLEQACRQARQWHEQFPTDPALAVAVNLAPVQLVQAGLRDTVARSLRECGLDPSLLVLEITESTLMTEDQRFGANLRELKALGLRLAIDDFGTGYSSLSRLRSFPVDILKIDRSFVQEITSEAERAPMVAAILAMARGMKLQVVAEGVETAEQLVVLRRYGCDQAQGYLLGRPDDTTRTEEFLRRLGERVHATEPPGAATEGAGLLDAKIIKALSNAVTAAPSDLEPSRASCWRRSGGSPASTPHS